MLAVVVANVAVEGEYDFERRQFGSSLGSAGRQVKGSIFEIVSAAAATPGLPTGAWVTSLRRKGHFRPCLCQTRGKRKFPRTTKRHAMIRA
jgi:hypothetical protein